MKSGRYLVDILPEGKMRVDGGIAFAGLPRSEWEKFAAADSSNRIQLGLNQILIRGRGINMLVDTGIGTKLRPRKRELMGLEGSTAIRERLRRFDLSASDITHVVLSHLHYDHCGGATEAAGDSIEPVFVNAIHYIQKDEWQAACNPDEISRSSYAPHDFLPLHQNGKIKFLTGDCEIEEGIFLEVSGGHTAAHQIVKIEDSDFRIIYPGDICPTPFHLQPERREAFDLYPCDTLIARRNLLRRIQRPDTLVVFSHSVEGNFFRFDCERNEFLPVNQDEA